MKTIYLAHPMVHSNEFSSSIKEQVVEKLTNSGFEVIDPSKFGLSEDQIEEIVSRCLFGVDQADAVVALATAPSYGMPIEVFHASKKEKPVYSFLAPGFRSPWIKWHSTKHFEKIDEMIGYLKGVRDCA